jgi:putative nucleotidyltransferase with HDIG domain
MLLKTGIPSERPKIVHFTQGQGVVCLKHGLWIGYALKQDMTNDKGLVIIAKGTVLTGEHLNVIDNHCLQITGSDIELPVLEYSRVPEEEKLISNMTEEFHQMFQSVRKGGKVPVDDIRETVIPSIHQVCDHPNLFDILSGIQAKDDYTYRHNIGVGVISTMIGKWLGLTGEELSLLTLAATLHDVGKVKIEDDILNKPGQFTDEEYATMKQHTIFGYELLRKEKDIPERVALVALQHHEREDGTGYPNGLTGNRIDYFSKIVGVADIFHAMTSKRIYKDAMPLYQVMQQMTEEGFGRLEPRICQLFVNRMMNLAIGGKVELSDGRIATILLIHADDPTRPFVQIKDGYYDLRHYAELHILRLIE